MSLRGLTWDLQSNERSENTNLQAGRCIFQVEFLMKLDMKNTFLHGDNECRQDIWLCFRQKH